MKLREYQSPQVNKLIRQLQNANEGALISAVGTGKTIVTAVVGDELIKRGIVKKVIVSAPFNTIVKEFPELRGKKILSGTANNAQYLIGNIEQSPNIKTLIDVITGNSSEFVSTSHHAMANHRVRTAVNQSDDLSDLLLVIDEAHHCFTSDDEDEDKDGTLLGEIAEKIKQKGGKILYVTATPYRTVGNQTNLIFDPLKCNPVIRTIGEQMRDGYAPSLNTEYIHVRDVKLINGGIAGIFGDLLTTRISDPQLKTLLPRIVKQWKTEKYPKTILLVPAGNADHTAQEVKKYLEEITFPSDVAKIRGRKHPSVLISVGDSGQVIEVNGKEMSEIEYDKANGGHIYDIVIGCRKFDEGTDVSSASHIFMVGLPSSVRLFHQRTGRVLRDKKNIDGYAEWFATQWVNTSKVVFFAPIGKKTKEFDYKVGRQLLHCIFAAESYQEYCESLNASQNIRIAFEDKHKKAKTEATRAELEEVMALLGNIELNELKDYSSNEFNELVKESLNPDMTVGERIDMIKSSTMSDAERVIALNNIVNHLPDDIKDKIDWDAIVNSIVKSVKKKKVAGFDVPPTSAISDVFDDVLREFYSVKITTNTERAVQQVFSSLSGETFKEWAEKCSQFMGETAGLMWINKICDFIDVNKTNPSTHTAKNTTESQLARKLFGLRQSYKNSGNLTYFESYNELCIKRGYPSLLIAVDAVELQKKDIERINNVYAYVKNTNTYPTKRGDCADLGIWLINKRGAKLGTTLSKFDSLYDEYASKLGLPNMFNTNYMIDINMIKYHQLVEYVQSNGAMPVYASELGQFVNLIRKNSDNDEYMNATVIKYLQDANVYELIFDKIEFKGIEYTISEYKNILILNDIIEYYKLHGKYPTRLDADKYNGKMAQWLVNKRQQPDESIKYLLDFATKHGVPYIFGSNLISRCYELIAFINDNGTLPTPLDKKLYEYISRLRNPRNRKASQYIDTYKLLDDVDMSYVYDSRDYESEAIKMVQEIIDYVNAHNTYPSSSDEKTKIMGRWLIGKRMLAKKQSNGIKTRGSIYPRVLDLITKSQYPNMLNDNWKDDLK
jgi:superfamily II DNA or RNA helicase